MSSHATGEITIRPAAPADAEALTGLHLDCWDDAYTGLMDQRFLDERRADVPSRVEKWRRILAENDNTLVAEAPDGLVGFVSSGPGRDNDVDTDTELWALYVRATTGAPASATPCSRPRSTTGRPTCGYCTATTGRSASTSVRASASTAPATSTTRACTCGWSAPAGDPAVGAPRGHRPGPYGRSVLHLLVVLVPLGLAAAVSPVMLTEQTVLMTGPRGARTGLAYAAGTATVLVVVVGAVLLAGRAVALPRTPRLDATLDLAIGGLLLALAFVVARWPRWHPARQGVRRRSPVSLTPPTAFAFGLFSMATNVTTLALVVPAAKEIAAGSRPLGDSVVAAATLVALATLPTWAPVALAAAAPDTAHRLLDALQRALHRYGRLVVIGLITAAGSLLVIRGVVRLVEPLTGG